MVAAALNAELAANGLFWAPHASTLNRATVGGMIATDAAGKGSLVHGRAHRHVRALDVVLDDGTPWRAEPTAVSVANRLAVSDDRVGALWRALLKLPISDGVDYGLPELARGFSGYGIDRFRRDGLVDPVALLCGSEGTLGVVTGATLALTPLPAATVLVVASYEAFGDALDDAVDLAATRPSAIESFDETTLERGRSSPAWPALADVVGERGGAVLLLEYSGAAEPDLGSVTAALARTGRSRGAAVVRDPAQQAAAWKVRADAVGLLAKVAGEGSDLPPRPVAMVEDCAVPVAAMPAFIAGFRRILDDADLTYGMFGHADVGCVHVRPALDLTDPRHERLVREVTDRVVELVAAHGGVLWGEHGRGFRGDVASSFLPAATIDIMRRVKTAFDPHDLLNPGKLYRPVTASAPLVALDEAPLRARSDRRVAIPVRQSFADAFACNGNGLCHHYGGAEVMCPSYKVTGDPAMSPKGRADLVRAWLAAEGEGPGDGDTAGNDPTAGNDGNDPTDGNDGAVGDELGDALVANLHRCLSCAACSGHCPVEVDIPELKSRVLDRYYEGRNRPPAHRVLSRFESLAVATRRVPRPLSRIGARVVGRRLGLVDLPVPRRPVGSLPPWRPEENVDLVLMPDVFTAVLEPTTVAAALEVLQRLDYTVGVAPFVPSGKFDHVTGRRAAFAAAAGRQAEAVEAIVASGAVPVVIEPAVALLHRHEYQRIHDGHPTGVQNLVEPITARMETIEAMAGRAGPDTARPVTLLGHCTERATAPAWLASWAEVLRAAGREVAVPAVGCCGMAGIFGHEIENQEMSRELFELTWAPQLAPVADRDLVATGYSCRAQAARLAGANLAHPAALLAESFS